MLIDIHHHILDNYYQHILFGNQLDKNIDSFFGKSLDNFFDKKTGKIFDNQTGKNVHKWLGKFGKLHPDSFDKQFHK